MVRQRSTRKDPTQETVLQGKDQLNERTTNLIKHLIELKRQWNGNTEPKFRLTDPMPDEIVGEGRQILQELSSIIDGLQQIDNMQDQYSVQRNQRLTERMKQMDQLQQQTQAMQKSQEMIKEASNPLTRVWAHIVAPFGSEEGKWQRLELLRALARLNKNLKDIEDKVLSGDPAILDALYLAKQAWLDANTSFFDTYRKELGQMHDSANTEIHNLKKQIEKFQREAKQQAREESQTEQGPLNEGGTQAPKTDQPPAQEVQNVAQQADNLVQEVDNIQSDLQKKVKAPVDIDQYDFGTEPPPIKPTEKQPEKKTEPQEEVPQPPELQEEVPQPPEPEPQVSQKDRQIALRKYISGKVTELYNDVRGDVSKVQSAPEPWLNFFRDNVQMINRAAPAVINAGSDREWYVNYLGFLSEIGRFRSALNRLESELKAKEAKPDFEIGTTLDSDQIQNEAMFFAQKEYENLQTLPTVSAVYEGELTAYGSNPLSRWLKRIKTHVAGGRDKNIRLQVARHAREAREGLQIMMDTLENRHLNFNQLFNSSASFYDAFINTYGKLADLADAYNARMRIEKSKRKENKERMPFDFIPMTDITQLKSVRQSLERDKHMISALDSVHDNVGLLQRGFEELQRTGKLPKDVLTGINKGTS